MEHVVRFEGIRNANKMWLCKPMYRRIQQENIVMDITERGFEGSVPDSTDVGSVTFRDFLDMLVLSHVARKE
jgi:hypothetical protein